MSDSLALPIKMDGIDLLQSQVRMHIERKRVQPWKQIKVCWCVQLIGSKQRQKCGQLNCACTIMNKSDSNGRCDAQSIAMVDADDDDDAAFSSIRTTKSMMNQTMFFQQHKNMLFCCQTYQYAFPLSF